MESYNYSLQRGTSALSESEISSVRVHVVAVKLPLVNSLYDVRGAILISHRHIENLRSVSRQMGWSIPPAATGELPPVPTLSRSFVALPSWPMKSCAEYIGGSLDFISRCEGYTTSDTAAFANPKHTRVECFI